MPPQAQILLKITRQKDTWSHVKKSKESNGALPPSSHNNPGNGLALKRPAKKPVLVHPEVVCGLIIDLILN